MNGPVILLDCDEILADFMGEVIRILNKNGFKYERDDFKDWDLTKTLDPAAYALKKQHIRQFGFCRYLPTLPGARSFVAELRRLGHVICLTAPLEDSGCWHRERTEWLREYFGFAPQDIIFCSGSRKHLVSGDVLIEDNLETLKAWQKEQGGLAILLDRPWNRHEDPENTVREFSYEGICITLRQEGFGPIQAEESDESI